MAPVADVEAAAREQGVPADAAEAIAAADGDPQIEFNRAIGAVAVVALLSLWFTRHLPGRTASERARSGRAPPDLVGAPAL